MLRPLLCLAAIAALSACGTTHRKARPDLAPSDRGAAELGGLLRDFKKAVNEHRFDTAEEMLGELEEGIKKADMKTIAHPDYSDIAHAVDGGRAALAKARREWAITQLIEATTATIAEAETAGQALTAELDAAPLKTLVETLEELAELAKRGEPLAGEARYQAFLKPANERRAALAGLAAQSRWRLDARQAIAEALGDYTDEAPPASAPLDDQIDREDARLRRLADCVRQAEELARRPGFGATLSFDTAFGALTLEAVTKACADRRTKLEQTVATLRWRRDVERHLTPASDAVRAVADQQTPAARLEESDEAIERLADGEARLTELAAAAGADPGAQFTTALGTGTLAKLTERWRAELARLRASQPTWRWQIALAALEQRAKEAEAQLATAEKADADDRVEELNEALGGFTECSERADHLAAKGDPTWQTAEPSKAETKAVAAIAATCRARAEKVRALLAPPKPPEPKKTSKKPKSGRKRKR